MTVPAFQELTFKDISYDVDDYPLWVDTAIIKLREIAVWMLGIDAPQAGSTP